MLVHRGGRDRAARLLRRRARAPTGSSAASELVPIAGPLRRRDRPRSFYVGAGLVRGARARRPGWSAALRALRHRCRSPSWSRPAVAARPRGRRRSTPSRPTSSTILAPILDPLPRRRASSTRPAGDLLREGDVFRFPELGRGARALRRRGRRAVLPRRGRRGDRASACVERGGTLGAGRPRRLRGDRPRARSARRFRGTRGADQPAALLGRDPDRLRARAARAARRAQRRRSSWSRRWAPPTTRASALRRVRSTGLLRASGFDRRGSTCAADRLGSTTHITGARRRRHAAPASPARTAPARACSSPAPACTSTTCSARRTSTRSASTRTAPGRRVPSMMSPTVVLRDGELEARARQRRLEPDPLGDPADDRAAGRRRLRVERGGRGAAPALRGRRRPGRARDRRGGARPARGARLRGRPLAGPTTSSSAASTPSPAIRPRAGSRRRRPAAGRGGGGRLSAVSCAPAGCRFACVPSRAASSRPRSPLRSPAPGHRARGPRQPRSPRRADRVCRPPVGRARQRARRAPPA